MVFFFLIFAFSFSQKSTATVYLKDGKYSITEGILDYENGVSFATFDPQYYNVGWDFLTVNTTTKFNVYDDSEIAYASGYVEGYLTHERILMFYNDASAICFGSENQSIPDSTVEFLRKQKEYVYSQDENDPYWSMARNLYDQYSGMYDGFMEGLKNSDSNNINFEELPSISYYDLFLVYSLGDLMDIMGILPESVELDSHCSFLLTYDPTSDDYYFAHTTWAWYNMNVRIFKTYIFNFANELVKNTEVYFSSYPGTPISSDDFYVSGSDLFFAETTLSCYNSSAQEQFVQPNSLLTWQRVVLASRFACTSEEWMKYFQMHNSGTYNDEWIVFDTNKLKNRERERNDDDDSLPANTILIADQAPGSMDIVDVTDYFAKIGHYFPSYNVPYSKKIYSYCEIDEYIKEHPDQEYMLSYDECVRALIFKRDQHLVNSTETMKKLMRYNDYQNDPLSKGNPGYAIASRWDLQETGTQCGGALDSKVVSMNEWWNKKTIHIISSPTYDQNPVFEFDKAEICTGKTAYHKDLPNTWKFPWIPYKVDQ